jgi:hypothetical protein
MCGYCGRHGTHWICSAKRSDTTTFSKTFRGWGAVEGSRGYWRGQAIASIAGPPDAINAPTSAPFRIASN